MKSQSENIVKTKRKKHTFFLESIISILIATWIASIFSVLINADMFDYHIYEEKIYYTDYDLVSSSDYIFIARLGEKKSVKLYDGTGYKIPYTFYSIEQIEFIKGKKVSDDSQLCIYGYWFTKNTTNSKFFSLNSEHPYLLIFANRKKGNDKFYSRVGKNDFIIGYDNQLVELETYNKYRSLNEQSSSIKRIIQRYVNIMNKDIANEILNVKDYETKEELVNASDFVGIVKIQEMDDINCKNYGLGSAIPTIKYFIDLLETFKNNIFTRPPKLPDRLGLVTYGVNYWEDEGITFDHYVSLLDNNTYYLVLANRENLEINNSLIYHFDFVVMDNYQLVKLDNYQEALDFEQQSEEIKNLVNQYITYIQ